MPLPARYLLSGSRAFGSAWWLGSFPWRSVARSRLGRAVAAPNSYRGSALRRFRGPACAARELSSHAARHALEIRPYPGGQNVRPSLVARSRRWHFRPLKTSGSRVGQVANPPDSVPVRRWLGPGAVTSMIPRLCSGDVGGGRTLFGLHVLLLCCWDRFL